jgi:hypothetical protein
MLPINGNACYAFDTLVPACMIEVGQAAERFILQDLYSDVMTGMFASASL